VALAQLLAAPPCSAEVNGDSDRRAPFAARENVEESWEEMVQQDAETMKRRATIFAVNSSNTSTVPKPATNYKNITWSVYSDAACTKLTRELSYPLGTCTNNFILQSCDTHLTMIDFSGTSGCVGTPSTYQSQDFEACTSWSTTPGSETWLKVSLPATSSDYFLVNITQGSPPTSIIYQSGGCVGQHYGFAPSSHRRTCVQNFTTGKLDFLADEYWNNSISCEGEPSQVTGNDVPFTDSVLASIAAEYSCLFYNHTDYSSVAKCPVAVKSGASRAMAGLQAVTVAMATIAAMWNLL
jgi:hypothetical protein